MTKVDELDSRKVDRTADHLVAEWVEKMGVILVANLVDLKVRLRAV